MLPAMQAIACRVAAANRGVDVASHAGLLNRRLGAVRTRQARPSPIAIPTRDVMGRW